MSEETTTEPIDDSSCHAGLSPLPRFTHPDHGELEIYGFDGRSKLCRSVSDPSQEYRIGTRTVNRLRGIPARGPASERTLENQFPVPSEQVAERVPEMITELLSKLPDGPNRVRIAREIWAAADAFLTT